MKIPYGYSKDSTPDNPIVIEQEADVIRLIYHLYLTGYSLGKIVAHLESSLIFSATGNPRWARAAIDKILSNPKYIPLVRMEDYLAVQFEKNDRSNIDEDTGKRKAVRYRSRNVSDGFNILAHL